MNLDADVRSAQPGDYRLLKNGSPVQPSSSSYENAVQDVICNLIGNQLVSNSLPSGTKKVVGFVEDRARNRAFFAVANSIAANTAIYKYENGTISLVMQNAILDFDLNDFVDMDIVGDILIFTNNRNEIKKINVVKAAAGAYTTADQINLIKRPPQLPLTFTLSYDNSINSNFIAGNYFQFYYRYIYEDNDYSVFSPCSQTTNSWLHPPNENVRLASYLNVPVLSGLVVIDNTNTVTGDRVLLLGQTSAALNGVWIANNGGAWTRASDFDTGAKDITVYVLEGGNNANQVWRIYSSDVGVAQTVSSRLDGPNKITINRPEVPLDTVIGIDYAVRVNATNEFVIYKEERTIFSSSHDFFNNVYLYTIPDSDSFRWNDAVPLKSKSIKVFKNRVFLFNNTEGYSSLTSSKVTCSLFGLGPFNLTKSVRVFRAEGKYNVGLIFHSSYRRNSGVVCVNEIAIPKAERWVPISADFYGIRVDTLGISAPSFATHFSIAITKDLTCSYFISGYAQDIFHYKKNANGTLSFSKTLTGFSANGTAIDIGSLEKVNKGYTFQQGDRIKISSGEIGGPSIDAEILEQQGRFIFTRLLGEIRIQTLVSDNHRFEIYTPLKETEPFYYEVQTYPIGSLGGSFDLIGDVEIGRIPLFGHRGGGYSQTDPFANNYVSDSYTNFVPVALMSIWDKNYTVWPTQSGRGLVKLESRQISKYTSIRFGQQYIINSNVLGINTFYALDEYAMPIENGVGTRLAPAGKVLVAVHEIETTALYIGEGFVNTTNQNNFLAKTDSVVGDDQKYLGGFGTLHPQTVVARDGRVYYLDFRKGVVVRRSQDGLTPISDYGVKGLISTLCNTHAALGADSRIIGGWDPQYDCYCLSFIKPSDGTGTTLYWHERSNGWIFTSDIRPELFGQLGQQQISFLNGGLWLQTLEANYNNFFGVQYDRTLDIEFSPLRSLIHIWDAIEVDAEKIYTTDGSNEDVVLLYQKNGGTLETKINYADFKKRESDRVWRSAFFRLIYDQNFTGPNAAVESKYKSSHRVRGQSAFMTIKYKGTDRNPMKSITIFYTPSMQSTP